MKFKESPLVKNHKILTGTKRDMRKKVVKSTTPTSDLKKPTTLKRQLGGNIFTTYNSITCLLYTSDAADDCSIVYISVVAVSLKKIFFKQKTAYEILATVSWARRCV